MSSQVTGLGRSEGNGGTFTSNPVVVKQEKSSTCKDEKQERPNREKKGGKEDGHPAAGVSPQGEGNLTTVTFTEAKAPGLGKITLQNSGDSGKISNSPHGLMTAEVNCGALNVKVEIKKSSLFDCGLNLVIKKRCPRKSQWCHDSQSHRCHQFRNKSPWKGHSAGCNAQNKPSTKSKTQLARHEGPFLSVSIVGKEMKVKYANKKEVVLIDLEPSKRGKRNGNKYGNLCSNLTAYTTSKEHSGSHPPSDLSLWEKKQRFSNDKGPDGCLRVLTPDDSADCEEQNLDLQVMTLPFTPESTRHKPVTSLSVLSDWERKCAMADIGKDNHREKENCFEDETFIDCSPLKIRESGGTVLSKGLLEEPSETVGRRESRFPDLENTSPSEASLEADPERRSHFPHTLTDLFLSGSGRKEDGSHSLSVFKPQSALGQEMSSSLHDNCANIGPEITEFGSFSRSPSSCSSLKSLQFPLACFPGSVTCYPPPEMCTGDALFVNTCTAYEMDCEELQAPPENAFCSSLKLTRDQEPEQGNFESPRSFSVWEEVHTDFSESGFDEDTLESEHRTEVQELPESKPESLLTLVSLPCSCPANGLVGSPISAKSSTTDCGQRPSSASRLDTTLLTGSQELEEAPRKWSRSVMTVITGDFEQRLIIQNDSKVKTVACCPGVREVSGASSNVLSWTLRDLEVEEPVPGNEFLSISGVQGQGEVHFLRDFPEAPSSASSSGSPEDDQIASKKTQIKEAGESGDHEDPSQELNPIRPESAGQVKQWMESTPHRGEKSGDKKEDSSQTTNAQLSTQAQSLLKDWKLGVIKPSGDLVPRDSNTSDSSQEDALDKWAKRRKLFKDSKKHSSTGGSSFASNNPEGSINSEDGRSTDIFLQADIEERGFYTESFHSASWIFRGDDGDSENSPRCLSKRPRPVAVRERTVRISKGTGDYPWGFRIQFSKPILVTEVDTNSAAEEAGLQIGDTLMAVNGADVTRVAHSEAVSLARKGPDVLTVVVGSDISRCPNTPRPTCRGYLHKRTHSGLLRGWRKRWFVLKPDGCLHYYKHKQDEGKCRPLSVSKLEGAEVGIDNSLGKPFVFKCVTQSGSRALCLCATSNQEMKRWLEAMDKARHPIQQNHVWVDVTLHNSSLPPLAIKNPDCLGLLHQLDGTKDDWVQRYCILKDGCLYFYASIRSPRALGGLYLQGYTTSEQVLVSKQPVIELKPPSEEFKTFYLCAENETENKRWITALQISIKKWIPLHQAIQDFMNRPLEETRM
ncbi:uncharacterized protein LOC119939015 [Tachyglossus aculeatus]|uniref:uncharacterized protein LOC119939015 n=1 Tax=Tachyglossus aculeatus TaxID=9261 RepID=UPI0018F6197F|nr:uncharacterized protein LOC119939015 [Tachyglossus aculeatus]